MLNFLFVGDKFYGLLLIDHLLDLPLETIDFLERPLDLLLEKIL